MWEINNSLQINSFLYSLILGAIFCAFYDVFRAIRLVTSPKAIIVFIQDIFFFLVVSFITFLVLLALTNGEIRGYILFGIVIGFFAWYFTFSKFLVKLGQRIVYLIRYCLLKINTAFNIVLAKTERILIKLASILQKFFKKLLKKAKGLLYTK